MTSSVRALRVAGFVLACLALSFPGLSQSHLIISQLYGGGGNSGSVYSNDFVELYNPTASNVSLTGYTLQYASTTGTFSAANTLALSGTVTPGHYFLIKLAAGANSPQALPTPDYAPTSNVLNLSGTGGKLALVNSTATLASGCPAVAAYVDFVGWSSATNCSYNDATGAHVAPATTNSTSLSLNATNTWTGVNANDYTAGAPNPRNSTNTPAPPPPTLTTTPIATIQANRGTYVGTTVQVTGVITVVTSTGFYVQTPSATPGSTGDEGILIYKGSTTIAGAVVGNNVTVSGPLTQYPATTASHLSSLEIGSPAVTVNSTGNALPAPIALTAAVLSPAGGIYQLKPYESMLVTFPSLTSISGTDGNLTEATETITSTGQFYATATGTARPFREPGIDFRDFPVTTCPTVANCTSTATSAGVARPAALTLFDDNPERIIVESSLGGGTALDVSSGAVIANPVGVIDFSYATDVPYGDPARLILRPGSVTTFTPGLTVQALPLPNAGEVTIAAANIERFFNTNPADDKYYNAGTGTVGMSGAVDVTQAAYTRRLQKLSLAIRNVLNMPDVLSLEEVENLSVLNDISAQIDADATAAGQTPPHYAAYGTDSVTTYSDDSSGISIGFLVKPATTNVVSFQQVGNKSTFQTTETPSVTETLNDRPSDVLKVTFNRGAGVTPYPMTLISNHLKSLIDIETSADTRLKKELQAEMLANLIQTAQANGEHVLAMGDMNAFEFSDGYTDTLGTITGRVAPANTVVQPGRAIVNPVATDLVTLLPANQRQSYAEFGDAEVLDHIVATGDIAGTTRLMYAHLNADFPLVLTNDATTPARNSDHDPALSYVPLPPPVLQGTLTGSPTFPNQTVGTTSSPTQVYTVTNTGQGPITISGVTVTGDFTASNNCPATLAVNATCAINVAFTPTVPGTRTGSLSVTSNASGIGPLALSGTGLGTPVIAFAVANHTYGDAPFTVSATSQSQGAFTYTVVSGPATISGSTVMITGAGSVVLQAAQAANGNYNAGSQNTTFTVNQAATATVVATVASPTVVGMAATFTATVTVAAGPTATGTVRFLDGTNPLGTATLAGGVATLSTAALTQGSHTITAMYQTNGNDATSSGSVAQVVNSNIPFSLVDAGAGSYAVTVQHGLEAQTTLTVTPSGSFAGTVSFMCTGLPANTSCDFSPATLAYVLGSYTAQTTTLTIRTASLATAQLKRDGTSQRLALAFLLPGLLLAGAGAGSRKLRSGSALLTVALLTLGLAAAAGLSGCGSGSALNYTATPAAAGTYNFNVVTTNGTTTQTLPVALTIQ